jgi:hypothetical protein
MLSAIGHGGTSVVYKCRERRTGTVRACKIIDRRAVEREHNVVMEQFQVSRLSRRMHWIESSNAVGFGCECWHIG